MSRASDKIIRLAAVGDNCMDVYDQLGKAFPGGNPVNVAVYTARLGGNASYTGVVGSDQYGELMLRMIAEKAVDVSHVRVQEGKTAVAHVTIKDNDRVFGDYEEGVMENFSLTDEDIDFICGHDCVVTGFWSHTAQYIPAIKTRGVPVAFDFADKWPDSDIPGILPYVDYAFFSHDDAGTVRRFLKEVYSYGPRMVIATMGEHGSISYDGSRFYPEAIVPVSVVDTMGAGDSFIAGFLYEHMRGGDIASAMRSGALCSSETLRCSGAW